MADELIFGHVDGFPPGTRFRDRVEASKARVHRPRQAGIAGSWTNGGADSIVVSGGYEDDDDLGNEIIYTGHGGNDPNTKLQIAHQSIAASGNRALAYNVHTGLPVRVIRGSKGDPKWAPKAGYRYDGLFRVAESWVQRGRSDFNIVRFRLRAMSKQEDSAFEQPLAPEDAPPGKKKPQKRASTTTRIIRDSALSRWVKQQHHHCCQVCGLVLDTPVGPYAEGAHIRPLGRPHNGSDVAENLICLCPNHHVLFDAGVIGVGPEGELIGAKGRLRSTRRHKPSPEHFKYHRMIHGLQD